MNRIDAIFKELRGNGRKALMPYVTAGDPDLATTRDLLPLLEARGASICELGIPFSDPIADGPVIQEAMTRALNAGVTCKQIMQMVTEQRSKLNLGVVAMVSYSIVHRVGLNAFCTDATKQGIDGLIVPDLAIEEAEEMQSAATGAGLILSFLISPSTPIDRAKRIAEASTGFIYLLSRAGITGEQKSMPTDLPKRIEALRQVTDLPIAVGFGISEASHVREVVSVADAAIVGSAIVRRMAEKIDSGREAVVNAAGDFVGELAGGL